MKIFFVFSLFLICLCLSALEEQLLLHNLEVAGSVGGGVNPQGAGRHLRAPEGQLPGHPRCCLAKV